MICTFDLIYKTTCILESSANYQQEETQGKSFFKFTSELFADAASKSTFLRRLNQIFLSIKFSSALEKSPQI